MGIFFRDKVRVRIHCRLQGGWTYIGRLWVRERDVKVSVRVRCFVINVILGVQLSAVLIGGIVILTMLRVGARRRENVPMPSPSSYYS